MMLGAHVLNVLCEYEIVVLGCSHKVHFVSHVRTN